MPSVNKTIHMGNLTADPELRHTPKGTSVSDFTLAVNQRKSDGGGGWKEEVTFINFTAWGANADNLAKYKVKGDPLYIEGRLEVESWEDKDSGKKRSKMKVVAESIQFLGRGGNKEGSGQRETSVPKTTAAGGPVSDASDEYDDEDCDSIPF